jgi:hypothetical protein
MKTMIAIPNKRLLLPVLSVCGIFVFPGFLTLNCQSYRTDKKGMEEPIDVGSRKQLFIDGKFIDSSGNPVGGYGMEEAVSVDRNGVDQQVWWRQGPDVGNMAGKLFP